jgi:signal transduction histidine kinase
MPDSIVSRPARVRLITAVLALAWTGALGAAGAPAELTSAAAVRSLGVEAAATALPVRLRGHLALVTTPGNAFVLLDRGEGIYVELDRPVDRGLRLGDLLEVAGVSDAGDFAPLVRAARVERLGAGALPAPRRSTIAELNAGGFDAAWIELRGIVRSCVPTPSDRLPAPRGDAAASPLPPPRESWLLTLAQGSDRVAVQVNGHLVPADLVDAEVRLRAVVFNVHNANRQFVRANLQVPDPAMVEVVVPPPADPFALPAQRLGEVLRFSRDGFSGHRVRVRGVVTGHRGGQTLWIRDGDRGMRIASAQAGDLRPGDEVEVAGFPDHGSYTPSLSDAVFRRLASGPPPGPHLLRNPEEIARQDGNLVQVYARLQAVRGPPEDVTLVLDWNGREVPARALRPVEPGAMGDWVPGSLLRVAGLCVAGQADFLRPTGLWKADDLQLWLRGPEDVAVLRPAPWLTGPRALLLAVGLALAALAAAVGVALAARRQLAQREEARKLAEVEFSAMLAERNRLARDIHDTLAQDLNAVSMQLELAKNASHGGTVEPVVGHLGAAHRIVRKCLAEARESIWNMRSHILERNDLPGALREVGTQLGAGSGCALRTRVEGRPRRLAPAVENNLLRIGQEAIANALKHARARTIEIEVAFADPRVRLVVRDDGVGLAPGAGEAAPSHFGLRGMRERVAQMGGRLAIGPAPGGGTRVEVEVDAPA